MKNSMARAWAWVPSLYFAEGLPYIIVITIAGVMFKNLGISNSDITFYTSWLYLPWVIKPIWSPLIDIFKTKRHWVILMQFILSIALAGVGLTIELDNFFKYSLCFLWLMAFSSATHDIAADGFYMIGLDDNKQSFFIGIRSTFYKLATIAGKGVLVILAGFLFDKTQDFGFAWSIVFYCTAALFLSLCIYHNFIIPKSKEDKSVVDKINYRNIFNEFITSFASFFRKKNIAISILFILTYRLAESQLAKIDSLFMIDKIENGGLALSNSQLGFINGTIGTICLIAGGIIGGILISRKGLKYWIWYMVIAINIPNVCYIYLAYMQPQNLVLISSLVGLEQFGYGFGFTAFVLYLVYISQGERKTAHYAIATGLMALGMMLPGIVSGHIQEAIGYKSFFIWIMICTIPSFIIIKYLKIDSLFGKKN